MKKPVIVLISLLILFTIMFSIIYFENKQKEEIPETTLVKCFDSSGAKILSSEIYFWGRLEDRKKDINYLKQLASTFSQSLGIVQNNEYSMNVMQNDILQKVAVKGATSEGKIVNIDVQLNKNSDNINESFISLNITEDLSSTQLEDIRIEALKVFKKEKITPKINSCITGYFEGKLEYLSMNEVAKRVFKEVNAKKVEGIRDTNLISVSAYSPSIRECIKVNGKDVNLNFAIRYNSYENRTYMWLATPIITTEY